MTRIMPQDLPLVAITIGEPAGIGPEISLLAARMLQAQCRSILIGDFSLLSTCNARMGEPVLLERYAPENRKEAAQSLCRPNTLKVIDIPLSVSAVPGQLDVRNAHTVLRWLDCGLMLTRQGICDALVTAPVQKSIINAAGIPFTGHTEYLADKTETARVVMMLAGPWQAHADLRVALATTHLPLRDIADALSIQSLLETLNILHKALQKQFGISQPRIALTGLNPHAGENGYLGREEIEIISPAIEQAQNLGINASGPWPADTLFQPQHLDRLDCVLAMYHDQGLPVLKHVCFGKGINITLGLPIIRTSPDHGTALDIATQGTGLANPDSMIEAMRMAAHMASVHKKYSRS